MQPIGIRSAGLGIAVKMADGATRAPQVATVGMLEQLGPLDARKHAILAP